MIPVILSGGSGTRLWPVSRSSYPKQFCELFEESLQTMTLRRLSKWGDPWIVTGRRLLDFTEKKAKEAGVRPALVLFEPEARNTAAAVALACRMAELQGQSGEILGIFPADHLIERPQVFSSAIELAIEGAKGGKVVTIGLKPHSPETGYGYIQTEGAPQMYNSDLNAFEVARFHEKPTHDVAVKFLQEGSFYWNAGIFVFKVEKMIELLRQFQPQLWSAINSFKGQVKDLGPIYSKLPSISIDYAILERLSKNDLLCVPCQPGWNDVGSWDAVADVYEKSGKSKAHCYSLDSKNNFILPHRGKAYATVGVDDLIVVDTEDALLMVKRGHSQQVKTVVDRIKQEQPQLTETHVFDERPWGRFEILREDQVFKSKIIAVNPGSQLSYQSHEKREEHWLFVQGCGEVVIDDRVVAVKAGSHVHIPMKAKHRVRNTGNTILRFIEVQLGTYFGEDDIVRYSDDYGRA
ncbi:MAG: mannose-1-phosphate guanylyltransferase/mannose-6-phosphate isomerase [Bdellovibrio sp.]|nr:MAG: mannose-1-phosphate guanylyltransferase/mannose-6-phosphate isomerase [Bdellovibrio sp.]